MTWTGQAFGVGQVLTAAQMTNLQADITALANGDAGAPAIARKAIATTSDVLAAATNYYLHTGTSHEYATVNDITPTATCGWICMCDGTYRLGFELASDGGGTNHARWYKNGAAVGTSRSKNNTSFTDYTDDISLVAGDVIHVYQWSASGSSGTSRVRDVRASGDVQFGFSVFVGVLGS